MCSSAYSSLIAEEKQLEESFNLNVNKWLDSDKLIDNIEKIIPNLKYLKIEGSEPSINSTVFKVLNMIVDKKLNSKIKLDITTNLTNTNLKNILEKFDSVDLMVSIDGYKKINDYIRYPSKWKTIVKNLNIYSDMFNIKILINHTVQLYNIVHIAEFINWYEQNYFNKDNVLLYLNTFIYPNFLRCSFLSKDLKKLTLEKLLKVKSKKTDITPLLKMLMINESQEVNDSNWNKFVDYTKILDSRRNQNILEVIPEFSSYWK